MRMTILKKRTGYALGVTLTFVGVVLLLILVWKWWDTGTLTSQNPLSALSASLWIEYSDLSLGIGLKPIHFIVTAILLVITGSIILIARREKITVTEETTILLECPKCKNQWKESTSKSTLEAMGYPNVKTLSRRKCAKCAKFIRPKIVASNV